MRTACLLAALVLAVAGAQAQKIESTAWGFDGTHVAPGFFNPLTVVVHNDSGTPFDDVLLLLESSGMTDLGAPIAERCYLAPGARRVVQFHPFVTRSGTTWWLRWASARFARVAVQPTPAAAWRGTVVLHDGGDLRGPQNELPTFPAAWFPAIPGAAEALAHAVLDFAPDWDEARAAAFLAWLRSGGTAHLVARDGRAPPFTGPLAVLADPRQRFAVGAGRVVRYGGPLEALRPNDLVRPALPPTELAPPSAARAAEVLSNLQLGLLPRHPWGLIFLAALAYVACVGPLHWRLARRRIDWRLSIGYLLLVVAAFTLAFGWLGARGYDEVSRLRTFAYGRVCGDGEVAVTQYCNAFATAGGRRHLKPRAAASLLSTAQTHEAVDGVIDNGVGGQLAVDMPMFSARGIVHRAHYRLPGLPTVRLQSSHELVVERGEPRGGFLLRDGRLWHLRVDGSRLLVTELAGRRTSSARTVQPLDGPTEQALLLEMVCERLQLPAPSSRAAGTQGDRALVLFRSPPELHLDAGRDLGTEDSHVLLDFDLPHH